MGPRRSVAVDVFLVVTVILGVCVWGSVASAVGDGEVCPVAVGGVDVDALDPEPGPEPRLDRPDPPVVIRINLTADGDARWTVASRFDLEDGSERAAFETLVEDVQNGSGPAGTVGYSPDSFRRLASRVQRSVDRSTEMRIESPEWHGRVTGDVGVLSLSFTWTNFARTRERQVVLGDVFRVSDEWFSTLESDQRLVIAAPPNYAVTDYDLTRPIDDGTVYIDGPANLTELNVSIVYTPTGVGPTPTSTATLSSTRTDGATTTGSVTPNGPRQGFRLVMIGGGLLFLAAVVALTVYVVSGRSRPFGHGPEADGPASSADSATDVDEEPPSTEAAEAAEAAGVAPVDADAEVPDPETEAGTSESDVTSLSAGEDELLSDEERVERLLERNGGRMKQANIVSETGWSNAKVSQLLSSMDKEGRIDKLRIGRENLISLPDEDVGDFE